MISLAANGPRDARAADLDGDGDLDVVSASSYDDQIAWYENLGGGSFGPLQSITTAADAAFCVVPADLDGDGHVDLVSASILDDQVAWYGNGIAGPGLTLSPMPLRRGQPADLAAWRLMPRSRVYFLYSLAGAGPFTHPTLGFVLQLTPPIKIIGTDSTRSGTTAALSTSIPASVPAGTKVWLQAVESQGAPSFAWHVTDAIDTTVQ